MQAQGTDYRDPDSTPAPRVRETVRRRRTVVRVTILVTITRAANWRLGPAPGAVSAALRTHCATAALSASLSHCGLATGPAPASASARSLQPADSTAPGQDSVTVYWSTERSTRSISQCARTPGVPVGVGPARPAPPPSPMAPPADPPAAPDDATRGPADAGRVRAADCCCAGASREPEDTPLGPPPRALCGARAAPGAPLATAADGRIGDGGLAAPDSLPLAALAAAAEAELKACFSSASISRCMKRGSGMSRPLTRTVTSTRPTVRSITRVRCSTLERSAATSSAAPFSRGVRTGEPIVSSCLALTSSARVAAAPSTSAASSTLRWSRSSLALARSRCIDAIAALCRDSCALSLAARSLDCPARRST